MLGWDCDDDALAPQRQAPIIPASATVGHYGIVDRVSAQSAKQLVTAAIYGMNIHVRISTSQDQDVHTSQLRDWVKKFADDPQDAFPSHGQMKPEQLEIARLGREVAKLRAEQDILKRAAPYFAKEDCGVDLLDNISRPLREIPARPKSAECHRLCAKGCRAWRSFGLECEATWPRSRFPE
jgi:transposase-like protein